MNDKLDWVADDARTPDEGVVFLTARDLDPRQRLARVGLMEVFRARCRGWKPDDEHRPLVCTPYGGTYDEVAGWMIVVNGSPPSCWLHVWNRGPVAFLYDDWAAPQPVEGREALAVKAFVSHVLGLGRRPVALLADA